MTAQPIRAVEQEAVRASARRTLATAADPARVPLQQPRTHERLIAEAATTT